MRIIISRCNGGGGYPNLRRTGGFFFFCFVSSLTSSGPDPKHASIGGWDVPVKLAARASRDRKQRKGEETEKWHEGKLDWTAARIKLRVIARKWDKHQHKRQTINHSIKQGTETGGV